ncbi:MAG TPA: Chromate resistance protein ChrB [Acidimicrobiia bacterium]
MTTEDPRWLLLAYKVPSEPSSHRIGIWRELKRLGAYYPQQAVCILPGRQAIREQVAAIRDRIAAMDGTDTYLEIPSLPGDQDAALVEAFLELAAKEYAEIVEECESKFVKEIEFERFRDNYTFEEAEEIRQDLDKIRRWYDDVTARDWFDSPTREEAAGWVKRCEALLDAFEADVYARTEGSDQPSAP